MLLVVALVAIVIALAAVTATAGSSAPRTAKAAISAHAAAKPLPKTDAVITVPRSASGPLIPSGFLGLSIENDAILPYTGSDAHALNPVFLQLIRNLTPGQSPVLRIGGDSTDWAWYPAPGVSKPGGVRVTLTPQWLAVMHALAAKLNARLILGVDLEADNQALATDEANAFEKGIGKASIEALELGNEPELYPSFAWYVGPHGPVKGRPPSYNFESFESDFTSFAKGLPGPLAGPDHRRAQVDGPHGAVRRRRAPGQASDAPSLSGADVLHRQGLAAVSERRSPARAVRLARYGRQRRALRRRRPRPPPSAADRRDEHRLVWERARRQQRVRLRPVGTRRGLPDGSGRGRRGQHPHLSRSDVPAVHLHRTPGAHGRRSSRPSTTG